MINAFHSNWTKPFCNSNKDVQYSIDDFEILTTILSALKWRENNGRIKMITDEVGANYYYKLGMEKIWDLGIDVSLDSCIDEEINSDVFWAAGKIFALSTQVAPVAMIDTDFIVWKPLKELIIDKEICTIHKEDIIPEVYPGLEYFNMKKGYTFNPDWDLSVLPCNTAFTYISNNTFKEYYTKSSIDFMKNFNKGSDKITNMVFAEQRLIAMCAKFMDLEVNELVKFQELSHVNQDYFTHTWGYKNVMRQDYNKRREFCIKCMRRIKSDFPEYEYIIANMEKLKEYYYQI